MRVRYTARRKRGLVATSKRMIAEGMTLRAAAEELCVSAANLSKWASHLREWAKSIAWTRSLGRRKGRDILDRDIYGMYVHTMHRKYYVEEYLHIILYRRWYHTTNESSVCGAPYARVLAPPRRVRPHRRRVVAFASSYSLSVVAVAVIISIRRRRCRRRCLAVPCLSAHLGKHHGVVRRCDIARICIKSKATLGIGIASRRGCQRHKER